MSRVSINRVELRGNVGQEPKISKVNETEVIRFSLATHEAYKDKNGELKEETTWHNVVAWKGQGMPNFEEIKKGANLSIEGKIRNGKFTNSKGEEKAFSEVIALKITVNESSATIMV